MVSGTQTSYSVSMRRPCLISFEAIKADFNTVIFYPKDDAIKETNSGLQQNPILRLVEAGEGRTPRPKEGCQNILQT
jgi:hypothetical protein